MTEATESVLDWFGVKLLHKIKVSGTPEQAKIDGYFHDINEFYEESVLLVRASSFDEAYQIAEKSAQKDNHIYENKYGQMVAHEFYKCIDCFRMNNSPKSSVEVYSTIFRRESTSDEKTFLDSRYDYCTVQEMHLLRHE